MRGAGGAMAPFDRPLTNQTLGRQSEMALPLFRMCRKLHANCRAEPDSAANF